MANSGMISELMVVANLRWKGREGTIVFQK